MFDTVKLWLPSEQKTHLAGKSLAHSLYHFPLTIFLRGELGAGKTTFLQGFAQELGIQEPLTSPTYALEQQYRAKDGKPFIHIDLYRLTPADAAQLLDQTDISEGIRCVEWADRLPEIPTGLPHIMIDLEEEKNGRSLTVSFNDMPIPENKDVDTWRQEVRLPENIVAHCEAVRSVTKRITDYFLQNGTIVRANAAEKAAALHDLVRFVDFPEKEIVTRGNDVWYKLIATYPGMRHEEVAAAIMQEKGFPGVARIIATHGLANPTIRAAMIEQKIVFYADKRAAHDKVVTLSERLKEFEERYGKTQVEWEEEGYFIEKSLFGKTPPF